MSKEKENIAEKQITKPSRKGTSLIFFNLFILLVLFSLCAYEYQAYKKGLIIEDKFTSTQRELATLNKRIEHLSSLKSDFERASVKMEEGLIQIPSIESKISSLNELVISKLSKDKDKLNLAISYLDDAMRHVRKMATWNFAIEAIQLARFNLLQYPDYIDQLSAIQNKLESYNLEPWYQLSKVTIDLERAFGKKDKSKKENVIKNDTGKNIFQKTWSKISNSIKVNKISDVKNKMNVEDRSYLIEDRIFLLLESASYAILTDKDDIYNSSLDKAIVLLSIKSNDEKINQVALKLKALKNYKSPVRALINDLEMVKVNLLARQEQGES